MKIAIVAHAKFPIAQPYAGGLEMITHLLVNALVNRGHDVDLYAHRDSEILAQLIPIDHFTDQVINKLNKEEMATFNRLRLDNYINYARVFSLLVRKQYDIIHNHSLNIQSLLMGNIIQDKYITTLHTPPFTDIKVGALTIKDLNDQYFTSVSDSLCKQWEGLIDNCTTIHNGIDLSQWRFSKTKEPSFLFWYGRICEEKAPHLAIEAALMAKKEIRLAGPIDEEAQAYYKDQVKPLFSNKRITYLGHLEQDEINTLLMESEAYLFTSIWDEPYGLVLAEALASGTPVIAFDVGAVREVVDDNTAIVVAKGDVKAMSEAILQIHRLDPMACRQWAEDKLAYHRMVDDYEKLYHHILKINQIATAEDDRILRT
ncbi:MAG: glycosyltransferase family 4 protein [Leeuwenhoekiella sp.]